MQSHNTHDTHCFVAAIASLELTSIKSLKLFKLNMEFVPVRGRTTFLKSCNFDLVLCVEPKVYTTETLHEVLDKLDKRK